MVTPKHLLEPATSTCCPWSKYVVGKTFFHLLGEIRRKLIALAGVKVHLPSVLPILLAFLVLNIATVPGRSGYRAVVSHWKFTSLSDKANPAA